MVGMSWTEAFVFVSGLCVGLLFHYWKKYTGKVAEKSAEIDAVQRKIDLVLDQLKKTTEMTEGIRADFTDRSSAKQRLFEMRREVAFRLMNLIGTLDDVLIGAMNEADMLKPLPQIEAKDLEKLNELHERYRGIVRRLGQLKGQVALVFDDPARELLSSLDSAAGAIIHVTNHFQYERDKAAKLLEIYSERYVKLHTLIRKQLLA
jgi:hypothetical protein